jgi:hypothetical protein
MALKGRLIASFSVHSLLIGSMWCHEVTAGEMLFIVEQHLNQCKLVVGISYEYMDSPAQGIFRED